MDTKKPVRLGVWGCGGHALNHLEHLPSRDLVTVTTLCDLNMAQMLLAAKSMGEGKTFTLYDDPARLLSDSEVDAIFIATPDQYHTKQIMRTLKAGKHVLAEKPLAIDMEQLDLLFDADAYAADNDLVFLTCHPRRFDSRNTWIRQNLMDMRDQYESITAFIFSFAYPAPTDAWKNGRGLLMDHVNHEVDLMHYLFGPEHLKAVRICDSSREYAVLGQRNDDIMFHFSGTRNESVKDWDSSQEILRIVFERGTVEVTGNEPVVSIFDTQGNVLERHQVADKLEHPFERYGMVVRNFCEVIRGEAEPYVSTDEMLINTMAGVELTVNGMLEDTDETTFIQF